MTEKDLERILSQDGYGIRHEFRSGGIMISRPTTDAPQPPQRNGKHNVIPTMRDGIRFDSKTEACRYDVLKRHQQLGIISNLETQPLFELIPAFHHKPTDARYRRMTHKADFRYLIDGNVVVEDWKGRKKDGTPYLTEEYKRTRKLLLFRYPDMIHFVNCDMNAIWRET